MASMDADVEDMPLVAERVYENALAKAWKDYQLTPQERESLAVIAALVQIAPARATELQWTAGTRAFGECLARASADGTIDSADAQLLSQVAASLGTTVRQLMLQSFASRGQTILQEMFTDALMGPTFTPEHWERLVRASQGLGLTESELQAAIAPQAETYVEHVLADAKADEFISADERRGLNWLMGTFNVRPSFREYVGQEVATVDFYANIRAGRLPSISAPHLLLQSGEIVHHYCGGSYTQVRNLRSGPRADRFDGEIAITDARILFSSPVKTLDVNHRRVITVTPMQGGVEVRASGKGGGYYSFWGDANLAGMIYRVAVSKVNQTIVERRDEGPSRHIPRDVRQRVWQRYGGRCADCGSTQYLEFDHIIPHARGGSSTDGNVQLLCRGCNLKKSDRI